MADPGFSLRLRRLTHVKFAECCLCEPSNGIFRCHHQEWQRMLRAQGKHRFRQEGKGYQLGHHDRFGYISVLVLHTLIVPHGIADNASAQDTFEPSADNSSETAVTQE